MGPIGRFVRARLRRRIFAWFAGGVVFTAIAVSAGLVLVAHLNEPDWVEQWEGARSWVGKQFAATWHQPAEREAYARDTAKDLKARVELFDAGGKKLFSTNGTCATKPIIIPVMREGLREGTVSACLQRAPGYALRWVVGIVVFILAVWFMSGRVARRLASPLDELTEVVKRIGQGDLKARTTLDPSLHDEIALVGQAVNDMAARIEKQMADQRELLATVSHELRTPLARLRIISEIARDTGATGKTFDELDREVIELDALAGQLLANSRLEFEQLVKRPLSLRDLATRAVERAGLAATALSVNGDEDTVQADATLLQRALANLLDNAKKHAGGADGLEVTVTENAVRFEVLDRGPGITDDAEVLFTRFNRGQHGRGADGLGLGLSLVKRIAVAHGGDVWAVTREGGGARVGFSVART